MSCSNNDFKIVGPDNAVAWCIDLETGECIWNNGPGYRPPPTPKFSQARTPYWTLIGETVDVHGDWMYVTVRWFPSVQTNDGNYSLVRYNIETGESEIHSSIPESKSYFNADAAVFQWTPMLWGLTLYSDFYYTNNGANFYHYVRPTVRGLAVNSFNIPGRPLPVQPTQPDGFYYTNNGLFDSGHNRIYSDLKSKFGLSELEPISSYGYIRNYPALVDTSYFGYTSVFNTSGSIYMHGPTSWVYYLPGQEEWSGEASIETFTSSLEFFAEYPRPSFTAFLTEPEEVIAVTATNEYEYIITHPDKFMCRIGNSFNAYLYAVWSKEDRVVIPDTGSTFYAYPAIETKDYYYFYKRETPRIPPEIIEKSKIPLPDLLLLPYEYIGVQEASIESLFGRDYLLANNLPNRTGILVGGLYRERWDEPFHIRLAAFEDALGNPWLWEPSKYWPHFINVTEDKIPPVYKPLTPYHIGQFNMNREEFDLASYVATDYYFVAHLRPTPFNPDFRPSRRSDELVLSRVQTGPAVSRVGWLDPNSPIVVEPYTEVVGFTYADFKNCVSHGGGAVFSKDGKLYHMLPSPGEVYEPVLLSDEYNFDSIGWANGSWLVWRVNMGQTGERPLGDGYTSFTYLAVFNALEFKHIIRLRGVSDVQIKGDRMYVATASASYMR